MENTSISERLSQVIDYLGVTRNAFAQNIGYERSQVLYDILNGKAKPSFDFFNRFINSEYSERINTDWLISAKGSMLKEEKTKQYKIEELQNQIVSESNTSIYKLKTDYYSVNRQAIPLYEIEASAGLSLLFSNQTQQIPLDHITLPNAPKCDGAIYIRGDSMYPLLKAGDIACYKTIHNLDNVILGEKYILDISNDDDDYLTVKYIQKSEKGSKYFKLVSENKYHADRDIHTSTIRALAMVKATIRFETLA